MKPIETPRLIIQNFALDEWQCLQELVIRYQETEYARYDHQWPTDSNKIQEITGWFASGDCYLAVHLKETGLLIGLLAINLREDAEGRVHNLGYIFHPDYHGQGFAFEGCRAVMHYLFDQLKADGIRTGTHPSNEPSLRLLKRLGLEGNIQGEFEITREAWLAFDQNLITT